MDEKRSVPDAQEVSGENPRVTKPPRDTQAPKQPTQPDPTLPHGFWQSIRDWYDLDPATDLRCLLLGFFLPPFLASHHLTLEQKRHQKFPASTATRDGTLVYLCTFALSVMIYWKEAQLLDSYYPYDKRTSLGEFGVWFFALRQYQVGICRCIYPFLYACLLRTKREKWPTKIQVWGSLKDHELERERADVIRRSGVRGRAVMFMEYTSIGLTLLGVWNAWQEGLGQEQFVREKREKEMEEARDRVEDEKKVQDACGSGDKDAKLADAQQSELPVRRDRSWRWYFRMEIEFVRGVQEWWHAPR